MVSRYIIGAAIIVALLVGTWMHGNHHGKQSAELQTAQAWLDSAETAREIQEQRQEGVNNALREQNDELAAVNSRHLAAIERLQQRANRAELSRAARAECKGATGAELSRQDGRFLVGEAARADRLRAALQACYSYANAITDKGDD